MLQWGTVFHQWLIQQCQMGPLPRSDNPSQPTCTPGRCQGSMMCCHSCGNDFVEDHWFLTLTRLNISASMLQWGTVFTNDWCSRPDGTITKVSDNPSQLTCTLGRCQCTQWCVAKVGARFCRGSLVSHPSRLNDQCSMLQWGTSIHQWLMQQARWDHYQGLTTLHNQHAH